ncbi:MAG: hypothetical protein ACSHXH_12665 [Marivita sp.]|uniref:hypothetical protein n=1 Tax=Marivita sp. TaxID=2003365 RepID=UPI003EF5868C
MRLALLIFALIASPALARDLPPEQPTYEKPTFERPTTPERPPTTTHNDTDEPREPRKVTVSPKPAPVSCPKVKCITDDNGHRRAMFTADVQPDMYYLGRNFCATAPKDVEVTACCLAKPDHTYQILYNVEVSKKAHKKAKSFCTCVLGLD